MRMLRILKSPSLIQYTVQLRWLLSIGVPIFIFIFLAVLRPFELFEKSRIDPVLASACFSFITFIFVFSMVFGWARYWSERLAERWTISYELLSVFITVTGIGVSNHLIMRFIVFPEVYYAHSATEAFFLSLGMTYAVAFFPVVFIILIAASRSNFRENTNSPKTSDVIDDFHDEVTHTAVIDGKSKENSIELRSDSFLYAKSAGNYVEFYSEISGTIQKDLQRITLAKLETVFLSQEFPALKTHRGYIVNTKKILSYKGNAQGYLLHFGDKLEKVPVSRKQIADFERVMNG